MNYTRDQIRSAYQRLSPRAQSFTGAPENSALIKLALMGVGLTDYQAETDGDSAVLYAMYGLHSLDDAILSIAQLLGRTPDQLDQLKFVLEEHIFSRMPE